MPLALVNPKLTPVTDKVATDTEGCLSVPEISGNVTRHTAVQLKAHFLNGEEIDVECGGLLARCLQHEVDHLNGVLFVDRLSEQEFNSLRGQLRKLQKQTRREQRRNRRDRRM